MALGVTAYTEAPFGAEASDVIAYPLGIELTTQENSGIVTIGVDVSITGTPLAMTTGQLLGGSKVEVDVTGNALSSSLGTTTEAAIGQQVDVTGFELTANASNPTHDTLTAFGEAPFATLSPATFNIPVGIEATTGGIVGTFPLPMSLGDVAITGTANLTLTGQEITVQEGQAEADDASAEVTGVSATISTGSVNITGWSQIDPGVTNVWTEVDKAA